MDYSNSNFSDFDIYMTSAESYMIEDDESSFIFNFYKEFEEIRYDLWKLLNENSVSIHKAINILSELWKLIQIPEYNKRCMITDFIIDIKSIEKIHSVDSLENILKILSIRIKNIYG